MADSVLIFLHLPKTAGTTYRRILQHQFSPEAVYSFQHQEELRAVEVFADFGPERLRRLRLICGHLPYGIHRLLPQPARYLTILRDPVERAISQYCHIQRNPHHPNHAELTRCRLTLAEFTTSGMTLATDNAQTRMLAGPEQTPFGQCGPDLLERALANLAGDFLLAGVTEAFEQTHLLASELLGWERPPCFVTHNVGPNRPRTFPPQELEAVRAFNHLDVQLHAAVIERLDAQCREHLPDWRERLPAFRRRNRLYQCTARAGKVLRRLVGG